jgi:hypothetical protein
MSESVSDLEARRRMLVQRSEHLRSDLASAFGEFETRLGGADRIFATVRGFASPSLLLSLGGLGFALLRRAHPFMWATRGVLIFQVVRRVRAAVRGLRSGSSSPARR